MENRKIVYNNIQYNILTSIKLGSTAFLICMDVLDKKIEYFKQENIDGKIKLTSKDKILLSATEVNQKSLSNKKRVLDLFINNVEKNLANTLFVDHNKVINEFKKLTAEIDNCDLKYYMIENASIEPTEESILKVTDKFIEMDLKKDLEQVKEIKNELYYFNTNEEQEVKPKEESVTNANKIEAVVNTSNDNQYNGPQFATDPFKEATDLGQTKDIENILNNNTIANIPKSDTPVVENKKRKSKPISYVLIFIILAGLAFLGYYYFFNPSNKSYTTEEIMKKVNEKLVLKEIDEQISYNKPENISSSYKKALAEKLIDVDITKLKSLNNNTVGWIQNNYLDINYPIVKGTNNSYYSNHDYLNGESTYGWIYANSKNDFESINQNTVIYGSSDLNSQFFYSLKKVLQADFVKDINNQIIKLSTDKINSSWLVFSIYEIPNEEYYATTEFKNDAEFIKFLDKINERSIHDFNIDLDLSDKILTLSTNKDKDNRIIIHAKLINTNISVEEDKDIEKGAATKEEEQVEIEKGAATKEEEQVEIEKGAATKEEEQIEIEKGAATKEEERIEIEKDEKNMKDDKQ